MKKSIPLHNTALLHGVYNLQFITRWVEKTGKQCWAPNKDRHWYTPWRPHEIKCDEQITRRRHNSLFYRGEPGRDISLVCDKLMIDDTTGMEI